jgi:hypothetical protein
MSEFVGLVFPEVARDRSLLGRGRPQAVSDALNINVRADSYFDALVNQLEMSDRFAL